MKDVTYQKFIKRWEEVTELPPQTLGPLTKVYKQATKRLKIMPWPWFGVVSLVVVIALYVVFGSSIAGIVSILQRGF